MQLEEEEARRQEEEEARLRAEEEERLATLAKIRELVTTYIHTVYNGAFITVCVYEM